MVLNLKKGKQQFERSLKVACLFSIQLGVSTGKPSAERSPQLYWGWLRDIDTQYRGVYNIIEDVIK